MSNNSVCCFTCFCAMQSSCFSITFIKFVCAMQFFQYDTTPSPARRREGLVMWLHKNVNPGGVDPINNVFFLVSLFIFITGFLFAGDLLLWGAGVKTTFWRWLPMVAGTTLAGFNELVLHKYLGKALGTAVFFV